MSNSKLSSFIDDPHQKFYYTYNFERPLDFHVELMKIILNDEPGKTFPYVFRSSGEAPRLAGSNVMPTPAPSDEFDFLNEMEYGSNDPEEIIAMIDLGISEDEGTEVEEEEDEFPSESYDQDDLQKEDY